MKRIRFIMLLVSMAILMLSGCVGAHYGSQAQYDKDNDWYFLADSGEVANIKYDKLEIEKMQEKYITLNLLQKKLQTAINSGNTAEVNNTLSIIDHLNNESSYTCRNLGLKNASGKYVVKIASEPFTGITLTPATEIRERKCIPVGLYRLEYEECILGGSSCTHQTVNVSIGPRRTDPITIFEK